MHPKQNAAGWKKIWLVLWAICGLVVQLPCPAAEPHAGEFKIKTDSNGKYWFVDPEGKQFISIGINNIVPEPWQPKPGSQYYNPVPELFKGNFDDWKKDVWKILQEYGFNTLGAWSDGRLYDGPLYGTVCLYVAGHAKDRCLDGLRSGFKERVRKNSQLILSKYPYTKNIFGVFLDNEMPWYGHAAWGDIPNYTLLEAALALADTDDAKQAALAFIKKRYATPDQLSKVWGKPLASWDGLTFDYARSCVNPQVQQDRAAFIELAADAFYKTACEIVQEMLPGKLILGTRFAGYVPEPVARACGRYCDVVSFNNYRKSPSADPDIISRFWIWSGKKPLMVTEYTWRAEENNSGNPNNGGAGAVVKTQAERGQNYRQYVEDLLSYPMVVGAHWFEFADQSPQGRFDGENSNYGIVDIYHRPYKAVLLAMKQTHQQIVRLHAESDRKAPDALPKPKTVVFEPGQHPERPPFVNFLSSELVKEPELFQAPDAAIEFKKDASYLLIKLNTGSTWGCGFIYFGPKSWAVGNGPDYATNLDGYSAIEIDAEIPDAVVFDLLCDEAGVAAPDAGTYNISAGDDAESFTLPSNRGSGERQVYHFDLDRLELRPAWGNQQGLRRVDIHAMKGVGFYFPGGQGSHSIKVYSFKLVR